MFLRDLNSPKSNNLEENSGMKLNTDTTSLIADSAVYFLVLLSNIPMRASANNATEI